MADKRKESRVIEHNNVTIKPTPPRSNGVGINAYTRDISIGGARIITKELFDVGSLIKIQIDLAGTNELISLEGEVKWLEFKKEEGFFELGVEFKHKISTNVVCLIRHIYQQDSRIPATVA
jgi:hypothetical protein